MDGAFGYTAERHLRPRHLEPSRRHHDDLALQPQHGAVDQSRREPFSRAVGAGFKRIFNLSKRQLADAAGDQARAEIAVGLQIMRRGAEP